MNIMDMISGAVKKELFSDEPPHDAVDDDPLAQQLLTLSSSFFLDSLREGILFLSNL